MISIVEELKPQAHISKAIEPTPIIDPMIRMNISSKHYKQHSYWSTINNQIKILLKE